MVLTVLPETSNRLRVVIGGEPRDLPILVIRESREFRKQLAEKLSTDLAGVKLDSQGASGLMDKAGDVILDLVLAYDRDHHLGGREYLEAHATEREIYDAFKVCLTETFPGLTDARQVLVAFRDLQRLGAQRATATTDQPEPTVERRNGT